MAESKTGSSCECSQAVRNMIVCVIIILGSNMIVCVIIILGSLVFLGEPQDN